MSFLRGSGKMAIVLAAIMIVAVPLVAGFFGRFHPALDSLSHFRAHLAVLLILLGLLALLTPLRREALLAVILGGGALATTLGATALPGLGPVHAALGDPQADRAVYRLLQMNLRFDNTEPEKVLSLIAATKPDVVTLQEVSAMWAEKLALIEAAYPHRILCPYPNGRFGVALLSRRPFVAETKPVCRGRGALAIARVDFGGHPVDVVSLHLGWPWPFPQWRQLDQLSEPFSALSADALMAGDLNAVTWSETVRRVAERSGMVLVQPVGPTWLYRRLPDFLRFAGLPIDHAFAKGEVNVHSARALAPAGSDHLPVLLEFSIRPPGPQPEPPVTATAFLF